MLATFLTSVLQPIASRIRNLKFQILGVQCEGYIWMRKVIIPRQWSSIQLASGVALDHGVTLIPGGPVEGTKLRIGARTYINRFTTIDAHQDIKIGENCMIGPYCYLTDADHQSEPDQLIRDQEMNRSFLHIEEGVWIGSHVVLLPGITIGKGAIVGAGSVVTKDVEPGSIVHGSPARHQRFRGETSPN